MRDEAPPRSFRSVVYWAIAVLAFDALAVWQRPSSICSDSGDTELGTMIRVASGVLIIVVPIAVMVVRRRLTRSHVPWCAALSALPVIGCFVVVVLTRRIPQHNCP